MSKKAVRGTSSVARPAATRSTNKPAGVASGTAASSSPAPDVLDEASGQVIPAAERGKPREALQRTPTHGEDPDLIPVNHPTIGDPSGGDQPFPEARPRPGATSGQHGSQQAEGDETEEFARRRDARGERIKVRATKLGYYAHTRRHVGDVFVIDNADAFSRLWMERVDGSTPERVTGSQEHLTQEIDAIKGAKGRANRGGQHTDLEEGVKPGTHNPLGE